MLLPAGGAAGGGFLSHEGHSGRLSTLQLPSTQGLWAQMLLAFNVDTLTHWSHWSHPFLVVG